MNFVERSIIFLKFSAKKMRYIAEYSIWKQPKEKASSKLFPRFKK